MNPMIKQLVNQKIQQTSPQGLVQLAKTYGYQIKPQEAKMILSILKQQEVDVFNGQQRKTILNQISKKVSPEIARQIQGLLNQFL